MNKQDISSLASVSSFDYNLMYLIVYDITNRSSFTHIKDIEIEVATFMRIVWVIE